MLCSTLLILATSLVLASCDVSHLLAAQHSTTTEPPPPKPYVFSYTAGRFPGHADRQHTEVSDGSGVVRAGRFLGHADRQHTEVSDGSGVVRGRFSYLDPRQKLRTVDYVADKEGFHPILSEEPPEHPADSESVARAKDKHFQLYAKIAEEHAQNPHPIDASSPRQSEAVALAAAKHAQLFRVIAEQHARIAAEREALQREEEEKSLQELGH